nr:MAG TPA: hypothetical protein [Caudoviricetes sp.]
MYIGYDDICFILYQLKKGNRSAMDNRYYEMGTENELATILSHYDSNFVYDTINFQVNRVRSTAYNLTPIPNIVGAWEQNFKAIIDQYGAEGMTQIQEVRQETYNEIINIICNAYGLTFTISDVDVYNAAYTLYDIFVCNMSALIINFFAKYIYKERNGLYDSMGLAEYKKNKDSSTIYGKKVYKDIKLAVINANIIKVIDNICNGMEFDYPTFIMSAIENAETSNFILSVSADQGNFFVQNIVPMIRMNYAEYITGIRFQIQDLAIAHEQAQNPNIAPAT